MRVAAGSKIRNLMGFAMKQLKDPKIRQITWNGTAHGISKTITCAEIMKRKIKGLHQVTKVRFKRVEEHWEPQKEGLERLKVNRDIPAITILLSRTPLDTNILGYQAPGSFDAFWKKLGHSSGEKSSKKQHKPHEATGKTDSPAYGSLLKKKRKRGTGKEMTKSDASGTKQKAPNRTKEPKLKEETKIKDCRKETDGNRDNVELNKSKTSDKMDVDT